MLRQNDQPMFDFGYEMSKNLKGRVDSVDGWCGWVVWIVWMGGVDSVDGWCG